MFIKSLIGLISLNYEPFVLIPRRGIEPRSYIGETRVYYWSVVWSLPELFLHELARDVRRISRTLHSTHLHGAVDGH